MKKSSTLFLFIFTMTPLFTIYPMDNPLNEYLRNEVKKDNQEQVLILLEQKANPNDSDEQGFNALSIAINNNRIALIKILLDHKADLYARNSYLTSSETYNSQLQVLERVSYNFYSISPLMEAARKGNLDCLKMLIIDYNVDIFFIDSDTGWSFFEYLVQKNHLESTEMVLEYAKEVDLKKISKMSVQNFFESLPPESGYKKLLRRCIMHCFLLKKRCKNISLVPKQLYLYIIKLSINPFYWLYNLLESKRIKYLFSSSNVLDLAQTPEMEDLLLKYYKLLYRKVDSTNSKFSYCLIF